MLQGKKISLRPIVSSDLEALNQWKNQEDTYQYLGGGFMPTSIDIQKKWLDSLMDTSGSNKRFMIVNSSNQPVGMVGLYNINWIHRTCEFGIFIGEKEQQGKGYGRDAAEVIEQFASKYCNLRKIKVYVVEENGAAVKMYEKLGYVTVGKLVEERFINGKYCSLFLMEKMLEKSRGGYKYPLLIMQYGYLCHASEVA